MAACDGDADDDIDDGEDYGHGRQCSDNRNYEGNLDCAENFVSSLSQLLEIVNNGHVLEIVNNEHFLKSNNRLLKRLRC